MKILIWVGCILVYSVFVTILGMSGITLGGLPVMLFSLLFVFLPAPALCKAWERRKAQKAEKPADPAQAAARRESIMAILNSRSTWIVVAFFALIAVSVISEERGRELGYQEAWELAYEEGHSEGYDEGYEDAGTGSFEEGYDEGYNAARRETEDLVSKGQYYESIASELFFFRVGACIVTTTGEKYHHYGCYHIEGQPFWIYNVELAEANGYIPCLDCWVRGIESLILDAP